MLHCTLSGGSQGAQQHGSNRSSGTAGGSGERQRGSGGEELGCPHGEGATKEAEAATAVDFEMPGTRLCKVAIGHEGEQHASRNRDRSVIHSVVFSMYLTDCDADRKIQEMKSVCNKLQSAQDVQKTRSRNASNYFGNKICCNAFQQEDL
jgi:hypothetical protein